jgi:O-antigen/teichoic acid export membrane protein
LDDPNGPPEEPDQQGLSGAQVRRRAGTALAAVGLRQLAIRVIALGGTVVLARLLVPHDFGAVAIGTTLVSVFGFVGDSGIGAGLIRGPRAPERADLQSFLGLQLVVTSILALATAAIGIPNGVVGGVTALMVASLPVAAFRTPAVILYERDLRYQPLVIVELIETLVFYAWAIGTVLAGWGVWGLASAAPVRAVVGAVLINLRSPAGFMLPRLSWGRLRPLLRFGLQYQAVNAVALVRDQGVNLGTAAIGGVSMLGLWSLAYRILQVPFLLFDAVWRVSFPAMARLLAAGEEPRPIMERGLAMAAMITGGMLAALVGSTPALVPAVFGHQWSGTTPVIPWAAAGLMFGGPLSVATAGYLYAVGDSAAVLLSAAVQALVWFGVAFPLLPHLGVQAIGIGWFASSLAEAIVLVWRTRRHISMHVLRHLALPAAFAAVAAAAGWLAASHFGPNLLATVTGAVVATIVYGAGMIVFRRALVVDAMALGRRSLASLGR